MDADAMERHIIMVDEASRWDRARQILDLARKNAIQSRRVGVWSNDRIIVAADRRLGYWSYEVGTWVQSHAFGRPRDVLQALYDLMVADEAEHEPEPAS